MVNAIIFVHDGKMFVIGMDTERPVYYPLTMVELKQLLEDTKIDKGMDLEEAIKDGLTVGDLQQLYKDGELHIPIQEEG